MKLERISVAALRYSWFFSAYREEEKEEEEEDWDDGRKRDCRVHVAEKAYPREKVRNPHHKAATKRSFDAMVCGIWTVGNPELVSCRVVGESTKNETGDVTLKSQP